MASLKLILDIKEMELRERKSRVIPFGYKLAEDPDYLEVIPNELEALEKAKWYYENGYTVRTTAEWLVKKTGRYLSQPGLLKAVKNVRSRNPRTEEIEII